MTDRPPVGSPHPVETMTVAAVEAHVYRVPIETPVVTSFGMMRNRPALFIRVVDAEGAEGWGEVWCNFPSVGAEHRARLVVETLGPLLKGKRFAGPREAFAALTRKTEILAIQSGEPGPLAQAIAGIDIALWDLAARRAGVPLHRFLGGAARESVPVYASGLNADRPEVLALRKQAEGYRRFKVKVGFGAETDLRNLQVLREAFGDATPLMIDANQAWDVETALEMSRRCTPFSPTWLEEPVRADLPNSDWARLARESPIPLAAGENLRGESAFAAALDEAKLAFLQPDIGKWGGFTGCMAVGRMAGERGAVFCPHWLGGGIGLIASAHLLAAVGGAGVLEVDANPNPLREQFIAGFPAVRDGDMALPTGPGLGVVPDLAGLAPFRIRL